jgi:segregation and condensation protein B
MEPDKLKRIVEAALLAADEPLTVDQLARLFRPEEVDEQTLRADLRDALGALTGEAEGRGYELIRVASGYRYQVRQELSEWISRLWEEKPPRYTRALLETLALVAYRQPVTRGDIEQVRGVSVSQSIMRTLLERGWIRVVGQREVPGRPAMYGTTREFLDYFNLKSLDQLPPLAEIRELIEPLVVEEAQPAETDAAGGSGEETTADEVSADEASGDETSADHATGDAADDAQAAALEAAEEAARVDLESDEFDAEIAAAIAVADAASARFNAPQPETTSQEEAAQEAAQGVAQEAADEAAADDRESDARPAQVVDVVTDLEGSADDESANAEADDEHQGEPSSAKVVPLPTSSR